MNDNNGTQVGRRSFLRRTATMTAGAALLAAGGITGRTAQAAPAQQTAAPLIDPTAGVTIGLLDSGNRLMGYFVEASTIGGENEIVQAKILVDGREVLSKIPGRIRYFDVTLTRGLSDDRVLADWRRLVEVGRIKDARRSLYVVVYDHDGQEALRWRLDYAWPTEFVASSADSTSIESITIVCEKLVRER